ncbi:MAG: tRNA pseudouridine(38-40) synthase TruA [Moraxella sp.]|nr:tRNA pseudouridine(38-40) synthase TruA [Moraxella sp.]
MEFIGTHYRGWQRQQHVPSIQACLENALSKVANEPIEVIAAGRTDAGVHASNMIAHFTTHAKRREYNWLRGVNTLLPSDIALRWICPMPDDFHARFKATSRRYRYITLNQPNRPAILNGQITHFYQPLDLAAMVAASHDIVGVHDFTSFRAAACQSNQPIRHIHHAKLFQHGVFLVLDIEADGFLHHMVRNLMGTLFAIGTGELPTTAISTLIAAKDRTLAPPTASPDGLYFINATYPNEFQQHLPKLPLTPLWLGLLD